MKSRRRKQHPDNFQPTLSDGNILKKYDFDDSSSEIPGVSPPTNPLGWNISSVLDKDPATFSSCCCSPFSSSLSRLFEYLHTKISYSIRYVRGAPTMIKLILVAFSTLLVSTVHVATTMRQFTASVHHRRSIYDSSISSSNPFMRALRKRPFNQNGAGAILLQEASFHNKDGNFRPSLYLPYAISQRQKQNQEILPFFTAPAPFASDNVEKQTADFGDILYRPVDRGHHSRHIREIVERSGHVFTRKDFQNLTDDDFRDPYYAFDDDVIRDKHCRRPSWYRLYNPSCNRFHEMDLSDIQFLNYGYYRDVFGVEFDGEGQVDVILKSMRYEHEYAYDQYEYNRMDALVMERLTSSTWIVDIYGHCATSVLTEALPGDIEPLVVPGSGYNTEQLEVPPNNTFTPTEKLRMALDMAEAIAELHGFADGIIVHDDIQLCQFLKAKDGTLKLNDFNRAEIRLWNEEEGRYCKYNNGEVFGNWRSPEEIQDKPVDEKIDVWSLGNNIYGLLTGYWVFYNFEDDEVVQDKLVNGETAYISKRFRNGSYAEAALVYIIERCWEYNPSDRASIFEVVRYLRNAVEENDRLFQ